MFRITDSKINYVQQVEKYIMPFDLLWTLLVYSSDEDFVYDLSKLVIDGEIVITVFDNVTVKDKIDVYTYDKNVKAKEHATFKDETQSPPKADDKEYSGDLPDKKYTYTITNKSYYESNTPSIAVTYANTWTMKYEAKVQKKHNENTDVTENKESDDEDYKDNGEENIIESRSDSLIPGWKMDYENVLELAYQEDINNRNNEIQEQADAKAQAQAQIQEQIQEQIQALIPGLNPKQNESKTGESDETTIENAKEILAQEDIKPFEMKYRIAELKLKFKEKLTNKERKVTTYTTEDKFITTPGSTEGKIDLDDENGNFVKLLKEHIEAYKSLRSIMEWFFESVELQESICDMEDLLKYLFQQVYNVDLGIEDFNFEEYGSSTLNSVGSGDALIEYVCCWENENLWDYIHGNGEYDALYVSTHITEDKKYYKMRADDGNTVEFNRNFGFGVCFYSDETYRHKEAFRNLGINITDAKYQQEGALLEVEIVDKVRDQEIRAKAENIRNRATEEGVTLDDAQIAALVNVSYQWGNIGNFFEVYKSVGQDRTNTAIRNFQASQGGTPFGDVYGGRGNSCWKLFSEGIYTAKSGRIITPSSGTSEGGVAEFALQFVGEDHTRFTSYSGIGDEWCAMFVSYCFDQCGLIPSILPSTFWGCTSGWNDFASTGRTRKRGTYIPKSGDIIFFSNDGSTFYHTGIVTGCDGSTVYTVEGNATSGTWETTRVEERSYPINAANIGGYLET